MDSDVGWQSRRSSRNVPLHRFALVAVIAFTSSLLPVLSAGSGNGRTGIEGLVDHQIRRSGATVRSNEYGRQGRILLQEAGNGTDSDTVTRPLAVKGGRLDPFDSFHKYRGGYDLESKHYWGSVIFTGIYGYAIAAAWLLLGVLLVFSLCCIRCCCRKQSRPARSPKAYFFWISVFTVALLTLGAIGASVGLYLENRNFTVEARTVAHTLEGAADNATETIYNITTAIESVQQLWGSYEISTSSTLQSLNNTKETLMSESRDVQHAVYDKTDTFDKIITAMEAALIVLTTLNVVVIILGPVCAVLDWRGFFYFVVVVSWIFTVFNAMVFGIYFTFENVVADTCDAMNEYRETPYNTTLDAILPCQELLSAKSAVETVAKEIRSTLSTVNNTLNAVQPLLSIHLRPLCESIGPPPDYLYISSCPADTIPIGELPQEVQVYRCASNDSSACNSQGKPLTDSNYNIVVAYSTGAQSLLDVYPSINRLTDCSIVVHAFSELEKHNCKPAKRIVRRIWIFFLVLTLSMIFLIISWLLLTYRSRQRKLWRIIVPQEMPVWSSNKPHTTTHDL